MLPRDSLGMFEATVRSPQQIDSVVRSALGAARIPGAEAIENVLVLGMGGSGLVGDLLSVIAGSFMPLPVVVVKNYDPPIYVNEKTLVLAVSFSGETEETLQAAAEALRLGGRLVAVTAGGALAELAAEAKAPCLLVDPDLPMPRAALFAMAAPVFVYLEELGFFRGASEWLASAATHLKLRAAQLSESPNSAQRLGADMAGSVPVIYGPGALGELAARRWKNQINENAKSPAFNAGLPEMLHNELVGWDVPPAFQEPLFCPIFLRHDYEHPQTQPAIEALEEMLRGLLGKTVRSFFHVRAAGEGQIVQLFDLLLFGDFASLYMAAEAGVDPGPVDCIARMKARLREGVDR